MSDFLSEEWFEDYRLHLRSLNWAHSGDASLVVGVAVSGVGVPEADDLEPTVSYKIRFSANGVELLRGAEAVGVDADVTFSQHVQTAEGVANGEISAQHGFKTGALKINGDSNALIANLESALGALGHKSA